MNFYENPEFESLVNFFEFDSYHEPDKEVCDEEKEMNEAVRRLKRKYTSYKDYIIAKEIYIQYCDYLINKYGGKKRFKFLFKIGQIRDYIPFCPELKKTRKNRGFIKKGALFFAVSDPAPDVMEPVTPNVKTKVGFEEVGNVKGIGFISRQYDLEKQLSEDFHKIRGYFHDKRVTNPTRMSKKLQKKKILSERYRAPKFKGFTDRYEDYLERKALGIYDDDPSNDPEAVIYYKDVALSVKDAEECEMYEGLLDLGIKLKVEALGKASRKVIRKEALDAKKKKKKGKKKKKLLSDKYIREFTSGEYDTFASFEKEMKSLAIDEFKKKGLV